jgi:hypothetical protein
LAEAGELDDWLDAVEERLVAVGTEEDPAESLAVLALIAGRAVELDEGDVHGAGRRALLLAATGGDPLHALALDGRAVVAFADDLDDPLARAQLAEGLADVAASAAARPQVSAALLPLLEDDDLAWRAFCAGTLAQLLVGDEDT